MKRLLLGLLFLMGGYSNAADMPDLSQIERRIAKEPVVRKLLHDPAPDVRLRTALELAEAHDAEAIPVLIDLLADLPAEKRRGAEEFLQQLAGEWVPAMSFQGE